MTSDPPGFIKPKSLRSGPTTPGKRTAATSHHFATPISSRNANATPTSSQKKIRPPPGTVSSIPFPPISAPEFGLIQEKLANDPFALLVAVNFLNKTKGTVAIPRFWSFLPDYPTPEDLATAEVAEVADTIRSLGLHNNRARTLIAMARTWVEQPPEGGKRHRRLNYPHRGAGKGIRRGEVIGDDADDDRFGAWEVAHLPGCGPYALDSWRIFCRDKLRGVGSDYNDARLLEPEWKRVVPRDKELRAFLRWMWLREGWVWDPLTGEKEVAGEEVLEKARRGEIV
ncbi:DNA glycosylase, partial [Saccharata proteae CBS 121410]